MENEIDMLGKKSGICFSTTFVGSKRKHQWKNTYNIKILVLYPIIKYNIKNVSSRQKQFSQTFRDGSPSIWGLTLFLAGANRAGGFRNPRTNLALRHRSEKRRKAFDSSFKVLSKLFASYFFLVKIEVTRGHQRSNLPKITYFARQSLISQKPW